MAKPLTIGNRIAPPRFLAFIAALIVAAPVAARLLGGWALGAMAGFDIAAFLFLLLCTSLLSTREAAVIREHATQNDANRRVLLGITAIVMTVLLVAIAAEAVGHTPEPFTRVLIIVTLILAWLFSNMIYALHYAHIAYLHPESGCLGFSFPGTAEPVYWDFVYFSFTCGMAFATSDVEVTSSAVRRIVTFHCLAAFGFNIGVLAFTINLLASGGG
jgi:uncharacterized membrane protein